MSKIYIAGPFSRPEERESLKHMIEIVSKRYNRSDLYVPMEYKVPEDWQKLDGTWNLSNNEWAKKVYEHDIQQLEETEMVFAMYVGHYCSSGTVWEMGYANGKNIPVIGYIPDWAKSNDMSLMVLNSFKGRLYEDGSIYPFSIEDLQQFNQK